MEKPLNEMRTLSIVKTLNPGLIIDLPILPYGGKDFVFDPASYGQYLGGTHTSPKRFYRENYMKNSVFKEYFDQNLEMESSKALKGSEFMSFYLYLSINFMGVQFQRV